MNNPITFLKNLQTKSPTYWMARGDQMALKLFRDMSKRVPAYRSFLKKHGILSTQIRSTKDFQKLPQIDKQSYLKEYTLEQLCWDGTFNTHRWVIASTSGSTGEPFYFPRQDEQDLQYAFVAELYLRENFEIHKKTTLYIDAFPMGPWIGGVFTYQAIKMIAERGNYPMSIITTSIDKNEIIKAVKKFGEMFDQIIIGCYAPFMKDALDDGIGQGLNWQKYQIRFVFSAEGFSETFRDYVIDKAGLKNPYKDTLNHYGTVDLGTMSYETPLSILIRRAAVRSPTLYKNIFPVEYKLPTLTQYIPELFYFEEVNGNLYCSGHSGLPLVRYDLKDHGGVIGFNEMERLCMEAEFNIEKEAKKAKISIWKLPFVYVYERSDFSVSFYAFQVYPETIKKVLYYKQFEKYVTGKFTMLVKFDKHKNQYIELNIEMKHGVKHTIPLKQFIQKEVIKQLCQENSEFRKTYGALGKRAEPRIVFWPYEHTQYFRRGIKQKWSLKMK